MTDEGTALLATTTPGGVQLLQSPRLLDAGFTHAFSTRLGGVSPPPSASLDLAGALVDDPVVADQRLENRRRFLLALGCDGLPVITLHQVHGRDVASWPESFGPDPDPASPPRADAAVTARADAVLLVRTADCVPILIAAPAQGCVAAVHAGWRGVAADVVTATIERLRSAFGVDPAHLLAAIGPCIGVARYEVGPEVVAAFEQAGLAEAVRQDGASPHVDLFQAVQAQLRRSGIHTSSIDGQPTCTADHSTRFFSHRRDAGRTGRMAAVIRARKA